MRSTYHQHPQNPSCVVTPLYVEWHRFLGDGLSVSLMEYLKMNQKKWEALINQEVTEEKEIEISELDEPEGISSGEETAVDEDSGSIDLLIPATYVQTARMPTLPGRVGLDRVGRRHSVPLSMSKLHLPLSQTNRRESLPSEQVKAKNLFWKIEDQSLLEPSSLSLLSSKSNMTESPNAERPVSAENLLPETSIASITSSTEASRLNTVLQSDSQYSAQTKQLTRQQTFPPLQPPCARTRYMSATAEMSQCYTQMLKEDDATDNSFSCSTHMKEKSCSSSRYSHDPNSRHQKKSNMLSALSKELLIVDIKKQGSTLLDITKHTVNSERRHSIQTVRTDDSFSKHRYKRPSSAQDPDPTQMFYATLTGSYSNKNKCVPDTYIAECKPNLNCNIESRDTKLMVQELQTTLSKKLDQSTSLVKSAHSAQEPRRYSTSITECKTLTVDNAGRRYTTIPVSSELSTHKVFFIGSPPDSPPNPSASSSDSGSDSKRSIDDSNKEAIVVIDNRKELDYVKEKNSKLTKFSSDAQMKENVDPRTNDDFAKALSRRGNQVI